MNENAQRALITAYFLSRFEESYDLLGFQTQTAAHEAIGSIFGLTRNAIKNRRDEFDPIHDNERVGWNQREMRPSRRRVVEQFQDVSREALLGLIRPWLAPGGEEPQQILLLLPAIDSTNDEPESEENPTTARTITGKRAEEHYMDSFSRNPVPVAGTLSDCREMGTGYDFRIDVEKGDSIFVEVKGLAGSSGQVTFTAKEWEMAKRYGDRYFVALVRRIDSTPELTLHRNPASHLNPKPRFISVIQETWTLSSGHLVQLES